MGMVIRARSVIRYPLSQAIKRIRKILKEQPELERVKLKGWPEESRKYKFYYLRRGVRKMMFIERTLERATNAAAKKEKEAKESSN